jgi:hypothetical protein
MRPACNEIALRPSSLLLLDATACFLCAAFWRRRLKEKDAFADSVYPRHGDQERAS